MKPSKRKRDSAAQFLNPNLSLTLNRFSSKSKITIKSKRGSE